MPGRHCRFCMQLVSVLKCGMRAAWSLGRPDISKEIKAFKPSAAFGCGSDGDSTLIWNSFELVLVNRLLALLGLMKVAKQACKVNGVTWSHEEFKDTTLGNLWYYFNAHCLFAIVRAHLTRGNAGKGLGLIAIHPLLAWTEPSFQ